MGFIDSLFMWVVFTHRLTTSNRRIGEKKIKELLFVVWEQLKIQQAAYLGGQLG